MFDTMRWSVQEPSKSNDEAGPPTIKNHSVTYFDGYLYCFGGYDGRRNHMTLLLYSLNEKIWIPTRTVHSHMTILGDREKDIVSVEGIPPPGRNGHTATLAKDEDGSGRIIIIGGWLGSGPLAASDVHVLELQMNANNSRNRCLTLRWLQPSMIGNPPGPCNMHSADFVSNRREVYVFRGGNGREYLNDLHALHVDNYQWRQVETTGEIPQQRANHSSAFLDETGELFIFGGWNGRERLNDIYVLDTETSAWTRPYIGGVLPHPRAGMTLTALGGRLFLFGGSGTSSKCFQDLQILDRAEMAWLEVEQHEMGAENLFDKISLDHTTFDTVLATDNEGNTDRNRIGRDRSTNLTDWQSRDPTVLRRSMPNPNDEESLPTVVVQGLGPGCRAGHTATAVNRSLYIFGGSHGSNYLNDFFVLDTDPPPEPKVTEASPMRLLERRLRHFSNEKEFSDVTFLVEGRRVYGHKLILSIVSDCFRAMFTTGFRESEANAEIEIQNASYNAFLTMMEYIYTGRISPELTDMHSICDLLGLADQFFLDHLKQTCEWMLQTQINVDTVDYLLEVAQETNAVQLSNICSHFLRNEARLNS
jgi:leucine-zipper-like transcriptional regulator 1